MPLGATQEVCLGRSAVRRMDDPRGRRAFSGLVIAGIAVVLLFAVLGVVSAGSFVADHVSSSSKPTTKTASPHGTPVAVQDVTRARAQATIIVKEAQAAGKTIVSSATKKASKQATAIVVAAKRNAASQPTAAPAPTAAAAPTTAPVTGPTPNSGGQATGTGSTTPAPVDLSGVPASWLVVAYNATFGSGPGSAGAISIYNRTSKTFSGVVRVSYARGGSATASYSGLAPGQSEVLALNGPAYPGGGYHITATAH